MLRNRERWAICKSGVYIGNGETDERRSETMVSTLEKGIADSHVLLYVFLRYQQDLSRSLSCCHSFPLRLIASVRSTFITDDSMTSDRRLEFLLANFRFVPSFTLGH
jgi:hypothetical protein